METSCGRQVQGCAQTVPHDHSVSTNTYSMWFTQDTLTQTDRQTIIQHMHCTTYRCGHTGTHAHPHPRSHIQLHIRTYIYTSVCMYVHIRCLLHMLSALALHTTNLYNCLGAKVSVRLYEGVPQCILNVRWELLVPHYVAQQVGC